MSISQNFPEEGPTLNLNFAGSKILDPRITFTRTSTGTYMGSDGLIKIAAANSPRFDHSYNPATGEIESLGLLVEESRVNLALDGTTFANPNWLKGYTLIDTLFEVSPDGTQNAAKLYPDDSDTNSQHSIVRTISGLSDNTIYTSSIFIKKFGSQFSWCRLTLRSKNGDFTGIYFNYDTKTFGSAIGGSKLISYDYEEYPNGWIRLYIVTNTSTGAITPTFHLWIADDNGVLGYNYTGGDADGFYIWGAQLEQGSFPTSYIPTTASTVTRTLDFCRIIGNNFADFYNQSEGSIRIEYSYNTVGTQNFCPISFDNGTSGETIVLANFAPNGDRWLSSGGLNVGSIGYSIGQNLKRCIGYKLNDVGSSVLGNPTVLDTDYTSPFPTQLCIGHAGYFNSSRINGHIKNITYYPTRLPNNILQNLTR